MTVKHPPRASDHVDAPHREGSLGDLALESGETIADHRQSFVTHGTLNTDRSYAILVCDAVQFGLDREHAIVGASMGGMQALQWGVSHPTFKDRIVEMTPMARTAPGAVLVTETARACLMTDPAWTGDGFVASPRGVGTRIRN